MPKLLVKHPEKGEMTFALTGDRITIGRRAENTIQINHGTISGVHAELVSANGHYLLRDLDSTNHCYIDGIQVSEADLNERCRVFIGTIECEYIPDPPVAALAGGGETDTLRKTIGLLRSQNEELVAKLSEQQKQIEILGSAKLLTPAAGADFAAMREKVKTLTAECDRLFQENKVLREQVATLRRQAGLPEDDSCKTTVAVDLPADAKTARPHVNVAPDGTTTDAAPVAKVAARSGSALDQIAALNAKLCTLTSGLEKTPPTPAALSEVVHVARDLAAAAAPLGEHPAARLSASIESLLRDIAARPEDIEPGLIRTVSFATSTLSAALTPEALKRCKDLPSPSILAIEEDKDLLPAITAALEFSRLPTTGCDDSATALETLKTRHFDLVLLDSSLPGSAASDLCSKIRSLPRHEHTPVLFLNGDERAAGDGANDVIGKPINMFELTVKAHAWALKSQLAIA